VLSRPSRSVSIYQSVLGNLALVIVLLSAAIMALTFVGSQQTVERLSGLILRETIGQIQLKLRNFFDPVIRDLEMVRAWDQAGLVDLDDAAGLNRLLAPVLSAHPQLSAVMVADERGREHILFHFGQRWSSRQTRRDVWGRRAAWLEWTDGQPEPVASWRESDYDPRPRPWYQGAIASPPVAVGEVPPFADRVYWTEPYRFFTAEAPGMTATMAFKGRDGRTRVVGLDVLLTDISSFTTSLRAGDHGEVMVLTDQSRVIGLPRDPRYQGVAAQLKALLKRPDELDTPVVADATRALLARPPGERGPIRLVSDGSPWWVDMSPFGLGPGRELSIEVMVPESDLLGSLGHLRAGIVAVMLAALALAIFRAAYLARRYSRPIGVLVKESERISRGNLEPGPAVRSSIREVRQLADAHERMRLSLTTLLKLEGDLQVARRIQQDTLPEQIPLLAGFDIDAWNEPADETGGDTYDVIGYERGAGGLRLSSVDAGRALLLLADASGHGIGPALSVTQVRSMLRMAVRVGEDLPSIIRHLNAQLCADLTEGRFVSAWLGDLDAREGTLTGFSCGQGPLIYYRAASRACESLATDAVPLGCLDDLEISLPPALRMEPGDIFVVLSDGVVEAENASGELFGTRRVIEIVAAHCGGSASELMAVLRKALSAFTATTPAADDRTAIIVKRV
jgi:serine phosphatase RsbU (regulator of sigma subunit)